MENTPPKPEMSNSKISSSARKKHILIVDDEKDITDSIKSALNDHYWVDIAVNALDALKAYRPHYYDLILLDFRMPNIDGAELFQEIKRYDPKQKVCFITAYEGLDKRIANLEWRGSVNSLFHEDVMFPLLKKPFDRETLLAKVKSIIGE
jgi:DNA-binding response OmpR family regulator